LSSTRTSEGSCDTEEWRLE